MPKAEREYRRISTLRRRSDPPPAPAYRLMDIHYRDSNGRLRIWEKAGDVHVYPVDRLRGGGQYVISHNGDAVIAAVSVLAYAGGTPWRVDVKLLPSGVCLPSMKPAEFLSIALGVVRSTPENSAKFREALDDLTNYFRAQKERNDPYAEKGN